MNENKVLPGSARAAIARIRARLLLVYLARYPGSKRAIDVIAALGALIILSPMFVVVALIIRFTSKGPVIFWQKRIGKWGIEFDFPKFRSMRTDAEAVRKQLAHLNQHGASGVTFKLKKDPRVTWIGRFIRKTSIDELPQLWCVLRGQMTLVGPRPPLPSEFERYSVQERRRLNVRPGLTCIWQTSGRSDIPFDEQVHMDLEYISRQSLRQDILLLIKTLPAVLLGKGAY